MRWGSMLAAGARDNFQVVTHFVALALGGVFGSPVGFGEDLGDAFDVVAGDFAADGDELLAVGCEGESDGIVEVRAITVFESALEDLAVAPHGHVVESD